MRTKSFDLHGRWWLPDSADHQVFGTLTWSADDGGRLHLHGQLHPVVWLDNVRPDGTVQKYRAHRDGGRDYPLILGRVENRAYTLLDSFQLKAREYDSDLRTEEIYVNRFLEGAWFEDAHEPHIDRIIIDMRHLTAWVGHSGLDVDYPRIEGKDPNIFAVVTAKALPPLSFEIDDLAVQLTQALDGEGDQIHELTVSQRWLLKLQKQQPRPLEEFLEIASDFQDLVSIATGKTAQFDKVVLQHPDVPLLSLAETSIGHLRDDIIYHIRWSNRANTCEPVKRPDMYFSFDDLGGIDGVAQWLTAAANYRTELGRVMATRYREAMPIEDRIFNTAAALDSFDKRRRTTGKWVKYAERVMECVKLAGEPFQDLIGTYPDVWVEQVVATRDDLAHHRERFRTKGTVGNYHLAEQLFWLFVFCMLRAADVPSVVYDHVTAHRQFRWLVQQVNTT